MAEPVQTADGLSEFRKSQLEQLIRTTPGAWLLSMLGAVICFMQHGGASSKPLLAWFVAFSALAALRCIAALYAIYIRPSLLLQARWVNGWLISTYLHAALWGLLALVLYRPGSAEAEAILHTTLVAIAMGGGVRLPGFPKALYAWLLLVLGPLVIRDLLSGNTHLLLMALLVILIGVYSLLSGRNQSQALIEIERQRRRNAELLEALKVEHERSETAVKSLEEASIAKTRFFAAANHDLRQPLHAMGLLLHTLPPESLEMPHRETVQRLSHCIDGMSEVVDGLLEMARLDSGQWAPQWTTFDAGAAIQECCKPYEAAARSKGQTFSTDTTVAYVRSDRSLFMRVLSNLVANAIRYTPKGSVAIIATVTDGQLHVSIEDSGIGIEAEHLPRIFEEFYQAGNPSRDRRQGLGLGLATVKRLSDLLSLSVSVRSSPGVGSVFSLTLPLASADDATPSSNGTQDVSLVSVRRVLVIEDDPDSRSALVSLLGSWGCVAQGSASVPGALALVDGGYQPDAAVVDFRLPDNSTGADAVRLLRERIAPDFPAVIVTGDAGIADQLRENGLSVMVKPVRPMQLRAFLSQSFTRAQGSR